MSRSRPLLVDPTITGLDYARAHAAATDEWFAAVARDRLDDLDHVALIAVGGYGRGRLCPYSDIDVILVHDESVEGSEVAEALWYPAWDRGLDIGYVVVTPAQAELLLAEEFEWSTAFLDTRLVAGSAELHAQIDTLTAEVWRSRRHELMWRLAESVEVRHRDRGDAATFIEPHLKEGRGGLRDVHALGWAGRATPGFASEFLDELGPNVDILLRARVELHRLAGRRGDVLHLDHQDEVAAALGYRDASVFMHELSVAARRIAWCSDEAWSRWRRAQDAAAPTLTVDLPTVRLEPPSPDELDEGLLVVGNGLLALRPDVAVDADPLALLRLAVGAARTGLKMSRDSLTWLWRSGAELPEPWPEEARDLFAQLFLAGRPAIAVVEDLDQFGLMQRLIPEWVKVHCRPQRNVLHTFTVDRHLCEAAVNAAELLADPDWAERIDRPDLLVVGTLLHDIGKGYPGDHTEVGIEIIAEIGERMGYPPDEVGVLVDLCRHHLLLPDVATRRDLSDPATIKAVAAAVDSVEFLDLLAALTEADSKATGPATWGSWKAGLLADLVKRTKHVLTGGEPDEIGASDFPTTAMLDLLERGETSIAGEGTTFTVVAPAYTGIFSALAGVLAVCGLDVLDAASYSTDIELDGRLQEMAAFRFVLQPPASGSVDWDRVVDTTHRALDGRVSIRGRVNRRAADQNRYRRRLAADPPQRRVVVDNDLSETATVVEVHASDEVGLLYNLTQVMQELRLHIRSTKIQTFGPQAVDSFYLTDSDGAKIDDRRLLSELELGLRDVIGAG